MSELERLMDAAEAVARRFLKIDGEAPPGVMISLPALRQPAMIPLPWESPRQKQQMLEALKEMFADVGVTGYALWSECWLAVRAIEPGAARPSLEHYKGVMPRDDPNRIDALIIVGAEKGQPAVMRHWQVIKGPKGAVSLKPLDHAGQESFGGQLAELLGKPPAN